MFIRFVICMTILIYGSFYMDSKRSLIMELSVFSPEHWYGTPNLLVIISTILIIYVLLAIKFITYGDKNEDNSDW